MPIITPKSPELVHAQVAAFAAETMPAFEDREDLLIAFGHLALAQPEKSFEPSDLGPFYEQMDRNDPIPNLDAMHDAYVTYLRSKGGSGNYQPIQARAELLARYNAFSDTIQSLKDELTGIEPHDHPRWLGTGTLSAAFQIDVADKKYAVKLSRNGIVMPAVTDEYMPALTAGRGIPHLEQVVAASYEDGAVVSELMPGIAGDKMSVIEMHSITDDQLSQLADTITDAYEHKIAVDVNPSNTIYDPNTGFSLIDYEPLDAPGSRSEIKTLARVFGNSAGIFALIGTNRPGVDRSRNDYNLIRATRTNLLMRYRAIVRGRLTNSADEQRAVATMDLFLMDIHMSDRP